MEEILNRCDSIAKYLLEKYGIEALIVACNTATSAAIKHLRENFLFNHNRNRTWNQTCNFKYKSSHVGVLATPATLKGDKYQLLVNELSNIKRSNSL